MISNIEIVPFASDYLDDAVRLSQQNKWPHRKEDWALMLSISEGVVAKNDGRVIGTALTTLYGDDHATSNMIIVDEAMQGRGLGRLLMNEVLSISKGRENRLVATEIGLPLYSKLGFKVTGSITQHQGILDNNPNVDDRSAWDDDPDIDTLCALDQNACEMDRSRLIQALVDVGRVAVVRDEGATSGFAILRDFGRGKVIGPVVCGDMDAAKSLLNFTLTGQSGEFMRLDIPDESGLYDWVCDLGLAHVGEHVRMTLNPHPTRYDGGVQTFALVSQALG